MALNPQRARVLRPWAPIRLLRTFFVTGQIGRFSFSFSFSFTAKPAKPAQPAKPAEPD